MSETVQKSDIVYVDPDFADLVPGFLANRRTEIGVIRSSAANGDFREVRRLGHGMKGAGAGYGFAVISDIGAELEAAATSEDLPAIESQLSRLDAYLSTVRVELER